MATAVDTEAAVRAGKRLRHHAERAVQVAYELERLAGMAGVDRLGTYTCEAGVPLDAAALAAWVQDCTTGRGQGQVLEVIIVAR